MLAAATKYGDLPADELPESAMEIFAEKTDNGAHLLLQHSLEKEGLYFASISPAASKQITKGNWRWPSSHTPGGVSCLVTRAWSPGIPSLCHETLVLSLRSKHEMGSSTIKKLTESEIILPKNKTEFFNALKVKLGILATFLDEDAYATISTRTFISNLEGIQEDLAIGTAADKNFLTKILYAQDHRFNKWLKECSLKPNKVSTINHSLIDFDDIISQIQTGISVVLPPAFTTVT